MNPAAGPELRDIHLPASPAWWPPAPGWWLLALALLVVLVFALRACWRFERRRRWRARVRAELERIATAHAREADAQRLSIALSNLLRRASRLLAPHAAALHGEAWLDFLDARLPPSEAKAAPFRHGPGRALLDAPYRRADDPAATAVDGDALIALARRWLAHALRAEAAHA
ncbi:MAG: DUF4381 domain-containing protein [Dokdonella sp.]|uniref:DUF4381 domain-containing protein n=1 Tax=Dokdonella sp. TaxID=2291710 RepID=UPI003F7DBFFB